MSKLRVADNSLWERIAAQRERWVGGELIDLDSEPPARTPIIDIQWDGKRLVIQGHNFSWSCTQECLAVTYDPNDTRNLVFVGPAGMQCAIAPPKEGK